METTFQFGPAMIAELVAIIVAAGAVIAIVFRRMVVRNEKRDHKGQQPSS